MSLLETISKISQFKIDLNKVRIEDSIFRLFSKTTVGCFFLCAILVTMQQLIGEHIKCILPPKEDVRSEALNQYCFIMSTYTVPHLYNKTVGQETAHFGVGPHAPETDEQKYHYYYQWVPFALFFQGLSFLIPHFLWKAFEEGKIKAYCTMEIAPKVTFKTRNFIPEKDLAAKESSLNKAAVYFVRSRSCNKSYAYFYTICEIMNFVLIILNFVFTNAFLGSNNFKNYGPDVVNYLGNDPESDMNPMNIVFPKVAKCDFHKYGPSGNLIRYDIMCVLALNIINEKIYVFLWFWFVITAIISGIALLFRLVLLFLPGIRNQFLRRKVNPNHKDALDYILQNLGYADWFVLNLISNNVNSIRFGELCESIKMAFIKRIDLSDLSRRSSPSPSPPPTYPLEKLAQVAADQDNDSNSPLLHVLPA